MADAMTPRGDFQRWSDRRIALVEVFAMLTAIAYVVLISDLSAGCGAMLLGRLPLFLVPLYGVVFWLTRGRHARFDYHMIYLPFVVWAATNVVYKIAVWNVTHGRAYWRTYGWDKGLQNVLLEPALVLVAHGIYLLRFRRSVDSRVTARFALASLLFAGFVALLFPPLGE